MARGIRVLRRTLSQCASRVLKNHRTTKPLGIFRRIEETMREQCRSIVTESATMSRRKRPAATGARILSQPAGALNKFVRAALATFALCAMFLRILAPTEAQPAAIQVDPRIVEL